MRRFHPLFVGRDPIPAMPGVDSVSVAAFGKPALVSYTITRRSAALQRALREWKAALLHAHFGVEGVYATELAKGLKVPLVTTLHGFDVTISKSEFLASRKASWVNYVAWRRALFSQAAAFVCVSEHIRGRALEWGYPADRLVVLPIGVDVEAIQPGPTIGVPRIVHIARLVTKKGTADLLKAFALVHKAIPGSELVIVGDGPLRAQLEALARELNVESTVAFLGARGHDETLRELGRARLLCLPSVTAPNGDQEGLPTVVMEAAAAGKPVVATRHGGIPEAIVDGSTGYLVAEHDVAGLADRLIALLGDEQLCDQFGRSARQTVTEKFSLRRQTERLEDLYRSLL